MKLHSGRISIVTKIIQQPKDCAEREVEDKMTGGIETDQGLKRFGLDEVNVSF